MKALYTLIILLTPFVGFGQDTLHCKNQYFSFKSIYEFGLGEFPSTTFLNLSSSNSDQNYDYNWFLESANFSFNTIPNNAYNTFSALIAQNDDIYVAASGVRTYKFPITLNQFEWDIEYDLEEIALAWEPIDTIFSGCSWSGSTSNTDFCQGFNEDIYYAQCLDGMSAILNISNSSTSVIAQDIPGGSIRSLVSHPNDTTFFLVNQASVFRFFPNSIGYEEINLPNAYYYFSLEFNNDGILYVAYEDSVSGNMTIAKENGNESSSYSEWDIIGDGNFYTNENNNILDFDSNNIGYFLSMNEYGGDLCLYKIEYDSVNLFNNFNVNAEAFAVEIDNYGNPHIAYVDNDDNISVMSYDGSDWTNIYFGEGVGNSVDDFDMQFNSQNDLYLLFEAREGNTDVATILTLLNCELLSGNVSSINENLIDVNIYPNPSSNIFNLEFNSDSEAEIAVTNILGEQVYFESTKSIGEFNTQIELSDYSKGIYNLTIKTSDGISNHKLILQ